MQALNKKKGGGERHALLPILWYGNFLLLEKFLVGFALTVSGTVVLKDKPSTNMKVNLVDDKQDKPSDQV